MKGVSGVGLSETMKALGDPGQHPEGRFLPETYAWVKGDSDIDVLKRAHAAMQTALDDAWASRAEGLWYQKPISR